MKASGTNHQPTIASRLHELAEQLRSAADPADQATRAMLQASLDQAKRFGGALTSRFAIVRREAERVFGWLLGELESRLASVLGSRLGADAQSVPPAVLAPCLGYAAGCSAKERTVRENARPILRAFAEASLALARKVARLEDVPADIRTVLLREVEEVRGQAELAATKLLDLRSPERRKNARAKFEELHRALSQIEGKLDRAREALDRTQLDRVVGAGVLDPRFVRDIDQLSRRVEGDLVRDLRLKIIDPTKSVTDRLLDAPVTSVNGVGNGVSNVLRTSFGIQSLRDLSRFSGSFAGVLPREIALRLDQARAVLAE